MKRYRFLALLGGSAAICAAWTIAPGFAVCQDAKKNGKAEQRGPALPNHQKRFSAGALLQAGKF